MEVELEDEGVGAGETDTGTLHVVALHHSSRVYEQSVRQLGDSSSCKEVRAFRADGTVPTRLFSARLSLLQWGRKCRKCQPKQIFSTLPRQSACNLKA